jgi:hypothetical protein
MLRDVARRTVGGEKLQRVLVLLSSARLRILMGTFRLAWMCLPNSHLKTWCAILFLWLPFSVRIALQYVIDFRAGRFRLRLQPYAHGVTVH